MPGRSTLAGAERASDWLGDTAHPGEAARLAALYDLTYDDRTEDVEWVRALASGRGGPILELGCGTGRIAVPLAQDGHRVTGLDRSEAMLERARARAAAAGTDVRFVAGDMRDFSFDEPFALVLLLFNTFLLLEPGDRFACLARVREHLAPDGRFALHVFQPDPAKIAGQDGALVEEGSFDDPTTGSRVTLFSSGHATVDRTTFTFRYDELAADGVLRRWERTATLHYLYRRELELLFAAAGLALESLHGDFDGAPADERSPHLLAVARRRERGEGRDRRR